MKIIGQTIIQKVIKKVFKSPETKNEAVNFGLENSSKVISLKDRRKAVDAFYKQAEKVKSKPPEIYLDDETPIEIKPLVTGKCGYFERHI